MKPYPTLSALAGIFRVLGLLGIAFALISFVLVLLNSTGPNLLGAIAQTVSALFGSLILLGLADLFAATLEIVTNLRQQKESLARLEIKTNLLAPRDSETTLKQQT